MLRTLDSVVWLLWCVVVVVVVVVVGHANTSFSHLFRVSLTRQKQEIWQPPPQSFNIQYFIALT